jgi:hypothetical protein
MRAAGILGAGALAAGFPAACSIPGIAPEGRELGLGGEIAAERDVVREHAEEWLGRNGYELVGRGSTLVAEKRAPSGGAGLNELAVLSVELDARGPGTTYAQITGTPYLEDLEDGGRMKVERAELERIDIGADVQGLWDAMSPLPRDPPT